METIKVSVDINVNLSDATKQFLISLFLPTHGCRCNTAVTEHVQAAGTQAAPATAPVKQDETKVSTQAAAQVAKPAPAAKPAEQKSDITIAMVRAIVSEKAENHKEELRNKLKELGASNVTSLDPAKYEEFYNYAKSL